METVVKHLTREDLEAGLDEIRSSPSDNGTLKMIVRRPSDNEREVIDEGELSIELGLVGDNWSTRGSRMTPDGQAHPEMQLNIMNSRTIELIAQDESRWQLAGDQLFADLNLSGANLPPGTQLSIGDAIIEVTEIPHMGCKKFVARFGLDAMKFVNSAVGRELHLRGINAKVVKSGQIKAGDTIVKL